MATLFLLVALHGLVALVFTWPLVRDWERAVPSIFHAPRSRATVDSVQHVWNVWWLHRALSRGGDPYECPELFHPLGARLYFDTLTPLNGVLAFPFVGALGLLRATNLMLLLNLVLSGLLASALGWEVTKSRAGALLSGLAFGPCPFVLGRLMGHWNLSTTAPLVLGVLLLVRHSARPRFASAMAVGLGWAIAGYSEYTYLLFLLVIAAFMAVSAVLRLGPAGGNPRRFVAGLILASLVMVVLLLPVLRGAWSEYTAGGSISIVRKRDAEFSADLMEYLTPNSAHPLWRDSPDFQAYQESIPYFGAEARRLWPGLTVLLLSLVALWPGRLPDQRYVAWWAALAAGACWLSMGGTIRFFGQDLFPPLYDWLDTVPILGFARAPGRYAIVVQLALAVLAGHGAARASRRFGRLPVALAGVLLIFELLPAPIPMVSLESPRAVQTLAARTESGAVWVVNMNGLEQLQYRQQK